MSDLDLDAIAQDHVTDYDSIGGCVCGESYPCTTLGLIAEVRALRGQAATLEDSIRAHRDYGLAALPHQSRIAAHDQALWSLLDLDPA